MWTPLFSSWFFLFVFVFYCFVLYRIVALTIKALNGSYILLGGKVGWEYQIKDQKSLFLKKIFLNFFECALTFCVHV